MPLKTVFGTPITSLRFCNSNRKNVGGYNLGYQDTWRVLEEMIVDFRRRGQRVPSKVMEDLKSARTMIRLLKSDATRGETILKVEEYLGSVESYVMSEGEKLFGVTYAEEWLKRLAEARRSLTKEEEETRFIPGVRRDEGWIRVKPSGAMSLERLKKMADSSNLSWNAQADGSLLVHGGEEGIRSFVRKMTTKYGSRA
jgi:hypothetical protein